MQKKDQFENCISLMNTSELRTCTDDEMYDYYEDPDYVDCEPPLDDAPKFVYVYNNEDKCLAGATCTNSGKCGLRGKIRIINAIFFKHLQSLRKCFL